MADPVPFTFRHPWFGQCRLTPQDLAAPPETFQAAYVELEGADNSKLLAFYRDGEWLNHKMRPFPQPVVKWYSAEKIDGTPIF